MRWLRIHQASATLLFRSRRPCPYDGDIFGSVGGARSRVCKADCSQVESTREIGFLRCHRDPPARLKHIICNPFSDIQFVAFPAFRCKLSPAQINWRSMITTVSVHEQELLKAMELFLSTGKDEAISMDEMYSMYIENLCGSGNLSDAAYLLNHLHDRGRHPSLNTYNILLAAASEANNLDLFAEIFQNLLLSEQPPDFASYVNIAKAFHSVADSELVLKFIMKVSELTVERDPTVMNRIIFVTAKSGQLDKSMMIFEALKNLDRKMDKVTFNTVLAMLGRAGRVDRMLSEFVSMKDLGHDPDVITYNTLINSMRRLGRLDSCKGFAKEMLEREIEVDLRTYTSLIDAFGRAGRVEDAMRIFVEMKRSHRPSVYVYRALISDLKKAGKFEEAVNLLQEMNSSAAKLIGPADFRRKRKGRRNAGQVKEGTADSLLNAID